MTEALAAVVVVCAAALVAWRWWLTELAARRRHEAAVKDARVEMIPKLEERISSLEWRVKK